MTANYPELDEALRKIGRNVLLFQRMERMLKYLIPRLDVKGNVVETNGHPHIGGSLTVA